MLKQKRKTLKILIGYTGKCVNGQNWTKCGACCKYNHFMNSDCFVKCQQGDPHDPGVWKSC